MKRRQLTVGELRNFIKKLPASAPVAVAPSIYNRDEPNKDAREFILHQNRVKSVSFETDGRTLTIGFPVERLKQPPARSRGVTE